MAACRRNLAGLQHRYDFPAVVEVASVVFELACAARAVVRRVVDLARLLIYLDDLSLLLLDGCV